MPVGAGDKNRKAMAQAALLVAQAKRDSSFDLPSDSTNMDPYARSVEQSKKKKNVYTKREREREDMKDKVAWTGLYANLLQGPLSKDGS